MTDRTLLLGTNRRPLLLVVAVGLLLMLISTLSYVVTNPGLVAHTSTPQGTATRDAGMPEGMGSGMESAAQEGVMKLMQRLQQNPSDMEALTGLTEH
ncbi:MAG: hypothetical protein RR014_05765, partial [Bilophila sp.]